VDPDQHEENATPRSVVKSDEPEPQHFAFGTGFRPGSNIKCNTKVKNKKIRGQLSGKQ
jgi:hypothetical protein